MILQVSPNNTIISASGSVITDAYGNTWGLTAGGQVIVNGKVDATSNRVLTLAFEGGNVWQMNTDRLWWSKTKPSDAWSPANGTSVSPLVGVASSDNTVIIGSQTAGFIRSITDADNDHWTLTASGQVALNGVADASTKNVVALAYEKGVLWQENSDNLWYSKSNAASPWSIGTLNSPIAAGVTGVTYLDGTVVNFINTTMPAGYSVTAVADGDHGVIFDDQGANTIAGSIRDVMGNLTLNVQAGLTTNSGQITVQGGIGGGEIAINVATRASFVNSGRIDINASPNVNNTLAINMGTSVFTNSGVVEANGTGQTITVSANGQGWSPVVTAPYLGSIANDGLMQVSSGAYMFLNAPVTGTGTLEALSNARILFNGSVAAGETVRIDSSVLEFGGKGTFSNPSMQFLGQIAGESASSTILLNGSYGTSESFHVLSTAGSGLAELQVSDASHNMLADLRFVGHFQAADFVLTPHVGASGLAGDNWTAISFSDHVNNYANIHS